VETARDRAEKIRSDFYLVDFNGPESGGETSLSVGLAIYPFSGLRGDEVLDAADQAMYSAKKSGGNRIQLHPSLGHGLPPVRVKRAPGTQRPLRKPREK
jgi:GGDEF domain-containing protein